MFGSQSGLDKSMGLPESSSQRTNCGSLERSVGTFSFMTTKPNELVATVHPSRMPVMLVGEDEQDRWLEGSADDALGLVRSYPADHMVIVQSGTEKTDMGE